MKKKVLSLLLCILLVLPFTVCAVADSDVLSGNNEISDYDDGLIPDEIVLLVRTRPQITQIPGSDNFMAYGIELSDIDIFPDLEVDTVTEEVVQVAETFDVLLVTLKLADEADMSYALNAVANHPDVVAYTQNFYCSPEDGGATESFDYDPDASRQWALDVIGVQAAWEMGFTGSRDITVAVVDTGIYSQHQDLELNIDMNNAYNVVNNSNQVADTDGHGTIVAGVIGADYDNYGINGVCQRVNIIPIKILNSISDDGFDSFQKAVMKAITLGADVINISLKLKRKFVYTDETEAGIYENYSGLIVTSAGNANMLLREDDNNQGKVDPPEFFIVVGASNSSDNRSSFSNYDPIHVDLFAPGENIYTTCNNGGYITVSGTSLAAPHVAAACALIMSHAPHLTAQEVKNLILDNVETVDSLTGLCSTGGRLAIDKAIIALYDQARPAYSKGDLNGDGFITATDYALAKRIVLGTYTPNETQLSAADINGNGAADALDYGLIRRYTLKTYYFSPY